MKWEFLIERYAGGGNKHHEDLIQKFGLEGWELVSAAINDKYYFFYFKRPLVSKE